MLLIISIQMSKVAHAEEQDLFTLFPLQKTSAQVTVLDQRPQGKDGEGPSLHINKKKPRRQGGTFQIGAGFSGQKGFLLSARVGHKSLFGIEGLQLSLGTQLSAFDQAARLELGIGMHPKSRFFGGLSLHLLKQGQSPGDDGLHGNSFGGALRAGIRLGGGWSLETEYKISRESLENGALLAPSGLSMPSDRWSTPRTLSALKLSLNYAPDEPIDPDTGMKKGLHFGLSVETSGPQLGSDFRYTRTEARLLYGLPLGYGFQLNLEAGAGILMGSPRSIPFLQRYRLGGTQGEEFSMPSLGAHIEHKGQQIAIGGNGMVYARAELRVPIVRKIGLYLFAGFEGGAVLNHDLNRSVPQLAASWNLGPTAGILWNSPIGPLRFNFSLPLIKAPGAPPVMFNFYTGNRF